MGHNPEKSQRAHGLIRVMLRFHMREIGQISPEPGLYRCAICGAEVYVESGESFPSCPGQDHSPRWILTENHILAMAGSSR
jgi:hypothetical protein